MGMSFVGMWLMIRPPASAAFHAAGWVARSAQKPIGGVPGDLIPSAWALSRSLSRRSGIGMSTGHTSLHAPHRLDAFGRSAFSGKRLPSSRGESTAPTGPG